jgi:hypothetical protein
MTWAVALRCPITTCAGCMKTWLGRVSHWSTRALPASATQSRAPSVWQERGPFKDPSPSPPLLAMSAEKVG